MIKSLKIANYKSIRRAKLTLSNLTILIGQNGAGKSNFISLFKFLERLSEKQLSEYLFQSGGISTFLHKGYEISQEIRFQLELNSEHNSLTNIYETRIITDGESHLIDYESFGIWDKEKYNKPSNINKTIQKKESSLKKLAHETPQSPTDYYPKHIYNYLKKLKLFHFHDTSDNAAIKLPQPFDDAYFFKNEGQNLAPYLSYIQSHNYDLYLNIVETVRLVFPNLQDFVLEESLFAKGKILLRWKEKSGENIYTAKQMSDGTLRFICLVVLLSDPVTADSLPETIILDEPELGLHPFAIHVLAELIQKAATNRQIIIATQSVNLINYFTPKDLLIVERNEKDETIFKKIKDKDFKIWLEEYSLGQLWENNFLGGRP